MQKRNTVLFIICICVIAYGCKKDAISNTDFTPTQPVIPAVIPHDSMTVLNEVTDDQGLYTVFNYDTATGKCKSFEQVYPSRYDSILIFYNGFGKIDRVVRKNGFYSQPDYSLTPSFFRYDAQQRLSHVFSKSLVNTAYSYIPPDYTTSLTDPYDYTVVSSYDSLVYDGVSRITGCYSKYNASPGYPNRIQRYNLMTYRPAGDSSLSLAQTYTSNSSGGYDLSSFTFNTYNTQRNPYADIFSPATITAFCHIQGAGLPMLPPYYSNYVDVPFLQVSKNLCTTFTSPGLHTLNYQINSLGLVSRVTLGASGYDWTNYTYVRIQKP